MDAANPSHALALVLVDELARGGVTDAVLAPGSRSTALAMALNDEPRIRLHVEIDERSADFLALGIARASLRPAPVVVTSGSAVANLHPAVVEADTGAVPLLLLTADRPPELRHTGANQAIEQVGLFARAPRWQVDLGVPEDRADSNAFWRSSICRALAACIGDGQAPAGPVHVNLPFREPTVPVTDDGRSRAAGPFGAPLDGRADRGPWVRTTVAPRRLEDEELRGLAGRLLATERGLIVAGATPPLASTADAAGAVHDLARATGWPVLAEPTSGLRTDASTVIAHAPLLAGHPDLARELTPDLVPGSDGRGCPGTWPACWAPRCRSCSSVPTAPGTTRTAPWVSASWPTCTPPSPPWRSTSVCRRTRTTPTAGVTSTAGPVRRSTASSSVTGSLRSRGSPVTSSRGCPRTPPWWWPPRCRSVTWTASPGHDRMCASSRSE